MPVGEDNNNAKILLVDILMPAFAKDQLDRTNLGWTLSPIIGHEHWKPKYNGNIHKIIRGKEPLAQNNTFPEYLLKQLNKAKKEHKKNKNKWVEAEGWLEDFFVNFCCNNELPAGSRHYIIEKNMAGFIFDRKDKDIIKKRYYHAQGRAHDTMKTWERAILNGRYKEVSPGEIYKFIKEHQLNFKLPKLEKADKTKNWNNKHQPIMKSHIRSENEIWEQVLLESGEVKYAVWDGKSVKYNEKYTEGDLTITPIYDQTIEEGAIILPSGTEEYGTTKELLEEIRKFIQKYSDISKEMEHISSWYVLLTWVYDNLRTVPYLRARGDTGCGKTRFLDTIGYLCYHATKAAGCVTPAPIYRLIRLWRGTLLLDEADFRASDESNEVIKILNCGFQKNMPVIRCNKNDPDKLEILPTYGPKIIATRQAFNDKALESRCLTEILSKTTRDDIPIDLTSDFFVESGSLRNKLLMFRFKNLDKIDPYIGINLDFGSGIEPRIKQAMVSFPSIFMNDPEAMEDFKKFVKYHQEETIKERAESFDGVMVNALADIIIERLGIGDDIQQNRLSEGVKLQDLVITSSEVAQRMEYGDKPVNPAIVSRHLKSLKINVQSPKKVEGKSVKPIDLSNIKNLKNVLQSYISDPQKVTLVSVVTHYMGDTRVSVTVSDNATLVSQKDSIHEKQSLPGFVSDGKRLRYPAYPIGGVTSVGFGVQRNPNQPKKTSISYGDGGFLEKKGQKKGKVAWSESIQGMIIEYISGKGQAPWDDVVYHITKSSKIRKDVVEVVINAMKNKGDLFSPRPGFLMVLS